MTNNDPKNRLFMRVTNPLKSASSRFVSIFPTNEEYISTSFAAASFSARRKHDV